MSAEGEDIGAHPHGTPHGEAGPAAADVRAAREAEASRFDRIRLWLSLVRFSHTVFALPFALAGLLLGARGWPAPSALLLVLACMVTARNAAMAFNRLVDARYDARNPRTADRHVPAGLVAPRAVALFIAVNAALFVACAFALNRLCGMLSPVALALVLGYSLTKRFTALCHVALGLAIGISPLAAYLAATGAFAWPPVFYALALLFWNAGFDIVYATQDEEFDRGAGLHSIPVRLGKKRALVVAFLLHLPVPALLWTGGHMAGLGLAMQVASVFVAFLLLYAHLGRRGDDLSRGDDLFRANALVSLSVLAGTAVGVFTGG